MLPRQRLFASASLFVVARHENISKFLLCFSQLRKVVSLLLFPVNWLLAGRVNMSNRHTMLVVKAESQYSVVHALVSLWSLLKSNNTKGVDPNYHVSQMRHDLKCQCKRTGNVIKRRPAGCSLFGRKIIQKSIGNKLSSPSPLGLAMRFTLIPILSWLICFCAILLYFEHTFRIVSYRAVRHAWFVHASRTNNVATMAGTFLDVMDTLQYQKTLPMRGMVCVGT